MKSDGIQLVERELLITDVVRWIISQKKLLSIFFVVALVCSGILIYLKPLQYSTTTRILVARSRTRETGVSDQTVVEVDSFASALASDQVLEPLVGEFELDQPPYSFSLVDMRNAIKIDPLRNEQSIRVRVKLPDLSDDTPQLVAAIANAFAGQAEQIAQKTLEEDIARTRAYFDHEFERSNQRLETTRDSYQEVFLTAPVQQKQMLIENLMLQERTLRTELAKAQSGFYLAQGQVKNYLEMLDDELPVMQLQKSLDEEPAFMGVVADGSGMDARQVYSATSTTEEENPVYTSIKSNYAEALAEAEGYARVIAELPDRIADLNHEVRAAELVYNACKEAVTFWEARLESAQEVFKDVLDRRESAVLAIVSDRQDLLQWTRAYPPIRASGLPRPVKIVLLTVISTALFAIMLYAVSVVWPSA